MKTEKRNKKMKTNINEVSITLEVESEVIDKVRTGEITHICIDINEHNQSLIL